MNDLKKILGSLNGDTIISDADIRSLCAEIESHRRTIEIGRGQLKIAEDTLKYLSNHATGRNVIDVCNHALAEIKYGTP